MTDYPSEIASLRVKVPNNDPEVGDWQNNFSVVSRKELQSCKLSTGTGQFLNTCGRNPKLFRDIDVAKSVQLATLTKVLNVLTRIAELPGGTAVMILLEILEVSLGQQ
jgi:hypothetical protein